MRDQDWANFWIAGAIVCPLLIVAGFTGWFVHWFWFETFYHPGSCRCRRCRRRIAAEARHLARLARASRR